MDYEAISRQARAAVDALTLQLQSLEAQQRALLSSLQLTNASLLPPSQPPSGTSSSLPPASASAPVSVSVPTCIPSFHLIAPTLSLIPTYEAKLTRLRSLMSAQTLEVTQLRRRAEEVKRARRRNLERIGERRERERERDRTVLRARMVSVGPTSSGSASGTCSGTGSPAQAPAFASTVPICDTIGVRSDGWGLEVVAEQAQEGTGGGSAGPEAAAPNLPRPISPLSPQAGQEGIRVVKRRKKVRQAEM